MKLTAYNVATVIVRTLRRSPLFPVDTGNLRDYGVSAAATSPGRAKVVIGNEATHVTWANGTREGNYAYFLEFNDKVGATQVPNKHKGFVEKIVFSKVPRAIKRIKWRR